MSWYEISAVSAALAFVVLVIYLIWTLQRAKALMRKMDASLTQITHTLDETARLSRQLMRAMRGMLDDLHVKLRQMQGVYDTIVDLGQSLNGIAALVRRSSDFLMKFAGDKAEDKASAQSSKQKQSSSTQSDSSFSESSTVTDWLQVGLDCMRRVQEFYRKQGRTNEHAERNTKE